MQPVGGENSEIRQDADADLLAHGLFDGGEVVAGEGNVRIFADLFGKPAGKTGIYGNLYKTPVFAAGGFQVAFMAVDAVGVMGNAAHGKVVLGGADEAQGDIGLAAVQVGECGIALDNKTYVVVFAVEIGNVGISRSRATNGGAEMTTLCRSSACSRAVRCNMLISLQISQAWR